MTKTAKVLDRHSGGRPRKWRDVVVLQNAIDEYFMTQEVAELPPTLAGLALALDADPRTLQRYMAGDEDDKFCRAIKKARLMVEAFHERRLSGANPTGSIFWLKNHAGYVDRHETDTRINADVDIRSLIDRIEAGPLVKVD